MTERLPAISHCRACGHVWACLWMPMPVTPACKLLNAACPACAGRKLVYMATKEQAAAWRDGPRGEPCFFSGEAKP